MGASAARVAEDAAGREPRDLEGHRQRHADRPGRARRRRRSSRRSPTAITARRSAASSRSRTCCASSSSAAIRNVVWITGDVHYCAAHHYDPARARFTDFDPFWEFVAGPLHAGTFGPNALDATFGPEVRFIGIPPGMKPNRPPCDGLQFFGTLRVDATHARADRVAARSVGQGRSTASSSRRPRVNIHLVLLIDLLDRPHRVRPLDRAAGARQQATSSSPDGR